MPIPDNFCSPVQVSARERAYSQLQRWIIDGTLHPGEKLNDFDLAKALGVSRTPVREALQLLEMQGFVEMHRGRDTRVTKIEKADIRKVYPPLAALQALAVELAVGVISSEEINQLRQLNRQFAEVAGMKQPFQTMEIDEQFHNVIVDAIDNSYISSFIANLQMHVRRFKYVFLQQPALAAQISVSEHEIIIDALEQGDKETAIAAMKQNWLRPMHDLRDLV